MSFKKSQEVSYIILYIILYIISSGIIRTAITRLRAVLNAAYHRDQPSQGYHLKVVLFQSSLKYTL